MTYEHDDLTTQGSISHERSPHDHGHSHRIPHPYCIETTEQVQPVCGKWEKGFNSGEIVMADTASNLARALSLAPCTSFRTRDSDDEPRVVSALKSRTYLKSSNYIQIHKNASIQHLYGETVSWSLAIASTAQLAIGRGSTPLGDTTFFVFTPFLAVHGIAIHVRS